MRGVDDRTGPSEYGVFIPDLCDARPLMMLVMLAELLVLVFVLADSALPEFRWSELGLASLLVQWVVLLSAGVLCGSRPLLAKLSPPLGTLASLLMILLVTLFSSLVAQELLAGVLVDSPDIWWLLRNLMMAAVMGGIALRYFHLQRQLRLRERAELMARLDSLRARIRPHFLFNTMNSIASLIATRPADAERAVEDLSELFRASLTDRQEDGSVADEIRLCQLYLRIEAIRLGKRLQVDWQVDEKLLRQAMPKLILQPLIENAVYHGVAGLEQGGSIRIVLGERDARLQVLVENPVPADFPQAGVEGQHMALENIRQRIAVLYGEQGRCEAAREGDVFRVSMSYPLESGR